MVLLGGMFTFMGPAFGATVIIVLEVFLGVITEYWLLVLGTVLVLIILFLPQGVIGFVQEKISAGTAVERKGADRFASG
jgi:branched-chain amino acid transport system permease protein